MIGTYLFICKREYKRSWKQWSINILMVLAWQKWGFTTPCIIVARILHTHPPHACAVSPPVFPLRFFRPSLAV